MCQFRWFELHWWHVEGSQKSIKEELLAKEPIVVRGSRLHSPVCRRDCVCVRCDWMQITCSDSTTFKIVAKLFRRNRFALTSLHWAAGEPRIVQVTWKLPVASYMWSRAAGAPKRLHCVDEQCVCVSADSELAASLSGIAAGLYAATTQRCTTFRQSALGCSTGCTSGVCVCVCNMVGLLWRPPCTTCQRRTRHC